MSNTPDCCYCCCGGGGGGGEFCQPACLCSFCFFFLFGEQSSDSSSRVAVHPFFGLPLSLCLSALCARPLPGKGSVLLTRRRCYWLVTRRRQLFLRATALRRRLPVCHCRQRDACCQLIPAVHRSRCGGRRSNAAGAAVRAGWSGHSTTLGWVEHVKHNLIPTDCQLDDCSYQSAV